MKNVWVDASSLLSRFFLSLDAGDYDALIACFIPSGTWTRQGKTLQGRAGIRDALNARPATLSTIHIVQNVLVDEASDTAADCRFYLTVYRHDSPPPPPYPTPSPAAVGLCTASLKKDGDVWHLAALQTGPYVFVT